MPDFFSLIQEDRLNPIAVCSDASDNPEDSGNAYKTLRMSIRLKIIFSLADLALRYNFVTFSAQNVSLQSKNVPN